MDPTGLLTKLDVGDISNIVAEVKASLAGPGHLSLANKALIRIGNLSINRSDGTGPKLENHDVLLELVVLCIDAIDVDTQSSSEIAVEMRTIRSVLNVFIKFHSIGDVVSGFKVLSAFLPILDKMTPGMSGPDHDVLNKYFNVFYKMVLNFCDSDIKEDSCKVVSSIELWNLFLRLSLLVRSEQCMTMTFHMMKTMSVKNENTKREGKTKDIQLFNMELLNNFTKVYEQKHHYKLEQHCNAEEQVNTFFNTLVPCMWHFLWSDLISGMAKNWNSILSSVSTLVQPYLLCLGQHHYIECFTKIVKIFEYVCFNESILEETFQANLQALCTLLMSRKKEMAQAFKWVVKCGAYAVISLDKFASQVVMFKSLLSPRTLSMIVKFVKLVSEPLLSFKYSVCHAPDGDVCPCVSDACLAFKVVLTPVSMCIEYKMSNQVDCSKTLPVIEECCIALESICNKATEAKCLKVPLLREMLSDTHRQLGIAYFISSMWKHAQSSLLQSINHLYKLNTDKEAHKKAKFFILTRLSICCEKQGLYKEAKAAVILHSLLCLEKGTYPQSSIDHQWCLLQNEDLSAAGAITQFVQKESKTLKSICPQFCLNKEIVPSFLLWELSCYASQRMKSSEIILNAWSALKASKPSADKLIEGSALACYGLFSCSDSLDWYELLSPSLPCWLSQIQSNYNCVALCAMGIHYFTKFLIAAQNHFDQNESKVVDVAVYSRKPSSVRRPEDVIHASDFCQISTSFENVNIQAEEKLMDLLDKSISYWDDSLQLGLNAEHIAKHLVVAASGECLLQVSYVYSMWGYHGGAARAFQVCHKFAKKLGRNDLLLQALSGLLRTVQVNPEVQHYFSQGEDLLESLKDHPKKEYLGKVFYSSRAFQALRTKEFSKGLTDLKKVLDFTPSSSTVWCYTYSKLLEASYSSLSHLEETEIQLGGCHSAFKGLKTAVCYIKERRLSHSPLVFAALVDQIISTSLWIGRYYLKRHMPREARSILKPELMFAVRLGLTTRAAELICELAFVDLVTENVVEADSKLFDLMSILGKAGLPLPEKTAQDDMMEEDKKVFKNVQPKKEVLYNASSPSLREEVVVTPILKHSSSCKCYTCRNCSVQNIWLELNHLQAKIYALRWRPKDSFKIYKRSFRETTWALQQFEKKLHFPSQLLQQHQLACTEISLNLDFVDMLMMYEEDQMALKFNNAIFDLLSNLKTTENELFAEALEQKICIINVCELQKRKKNELKSGKTPVDSRSPSQPVIKTPEQYVGISTPVQPQMKKRIRQPLTPLGSTNLLTPHSAQYSNFEFIKSKAPLNFVDLAEKMSPDPQVKENFSIPAPRKRTQQNQAGACNSLKAILDENTSQIDKKSSKILNLKTKSKPKVTAKHHEISTSILEVPATSRDKTLESNLCQPVKPAKARNLVEESATGKTRAASSRPASKLSENKTRFTRSTHAK